jgi:hypothetical protein
VPLRQGEPHYVPSTQRIVATARRVMER